VAGVPPVILRPSDSPAVALAPPVHTEESAAVRAKSHKAKVKAKGKGKAKAKAKSQKKGKPVKKTGRRS